jgi:hypothetical protein
LTKNRGQSEQWTTGYVEKCSPFFTRTKHVHVSRLLAILRHFYSIRLFAALAFLPNIPPQKMRAAFILPAIGCSTTFLIICAHFDNKYFPDVWREIFKDGSRSELYIISAMVAFWIAGLYICTGIHSVGYVQANVFFSSWAAFATSLMTLKLWRESAGLPSLFDKLVNHSRMTSEYHFSNAWCVRMCSMSCQLCSHVHVHLPVFMASLYYDRTQFIPIPCHLNSLQLDVGGEFQHNYAL